MLCIKGKHFYFILRSFIHLSSFTNIWLRKTAQKKCEKCKRRKEIGEIEYFFLFCIWEISTLLLLLQQKKKKGISRRVKFNEEEIFCAFVIKLILLFFFCVCCFYEIQYHISKNNSMISHCYCSQREGQNRHWGRVVIEIMNEIVVGVINGIYVINIIIPIKYFILINFQIKSKTKIVSKILKIIFFFV